MKIETSELIGAALDWAVAKCEGFKIIKMHTFDGNGKAVAWIGHSYSPSTDWSQGGPIIEQKKISLAILGDTFYCGMRHPDPMTRDHTGTGSTPLIAAMRCLVASKLGDEVEIPDQVIGG